MAHRDVMRLPGQGFGHLDGETHSDAPGFRTGRRQGSIIEPAAAAKPRARGIEGKPRTQEGVHVFDRHHGMDPRERFHDAELPPCEGGRVLDQVKFKPLIRVHQRVEQLDFPSQAMKRGEIGLTGQRGIDSQFPDLRVHLKPIRDPARDGGGSAGQVRLPGVSQDGTIVGPERGFVWGSWWICHLRSGSGDWTIGPMMRILQAAALTACLVSAAFAQDIGPPPEAPGEPPGEKQDDPPEFLYDPPVVERQLFGEGVNMLAQERDQYATNLATFAANLVADQDASDEALAECRRMLALAMHLSPRNRQTLIVNFQLKKGVIPQVKKSDYSASVLSRLLLSRSRLLGQGQKPAEQLLARCFVEMAATLDPRNEDAVFAFEIQRLDHGDVDWDAITDVKKPPEEPAPSPEPPAPASEGP